MRRPNFSDFDWNPLMQRALHLAALGDGCTSPNPLVGAVVVDTTGRIVGEGFHLRAGLPHAEVEALSQAGALAKEGTLIVNLEPCCHFGRTPPCTEAILNSGIKRVVVAIKDPDPRVSGLGISTLRKADIEVITGVLEEEAAFQNRAFIFRVKNGRPLGILKWAMTLDGRVGLPNGDSKWISGKPARNWVHRLRSKCDAVIVGGGTLRADDPLLTTRGLAEQEPLRVVLTESLELPLQAKLWDTTNARTLIAHGSKCSSEFSRRFPQGPDRVTLKSVQPLELLENLVERGCNRVLWECGPSLASAAIRQNCVQEIAVVIAPKILGGDSSCTPLADLGFISMQEAIILENRSFQSIGSDKVLHMLLPKA